MSPPTRLDYHLVHTAIPVKLQILNSLGVFPHGINASLSLFCMIGFQMAKNRQTLQSSSNLIPISPQTAQGRLHCTDTPSKTSYQMQVYPQAVVHARFKINRDSHALRPPRRRGPRLHAIADRPVRLNPQHQLPTGRRRPAPGTSSICPLRIFRPVFKDGDPD